MKIRLMNNHVVLQVEDFFSGKIDIAGGKVLYVDTTTRNPKYATTKGEVVQLPEKLVCCDNTNPNSLEWETDIEIQPGDKVWFQYDAMIFAFKSDVLNYVDNGKIFILVNYKYLYVARRGDQVIPLNGYCIMEPVYQDQCPSDLILPHLKTKGLIVETHQKLSNILRVKYVAVKNKRYSDDIYSDEGDLNPGDYVLVRPHSDVPLEYDIYRSFDKKNELYRVQRRQILSVLENGK